MIEAPTVKAKDIPQRQREQLAAPLLTIVCEAFEDPRIQREFEDWKRKKEAKGGKAK